MQFLCLFLWEKTNPISTLHVFVQVLLLEQMQCLLQFCSGKILYVGTALPSLLPLHLRFSMWGAQEMIKLHIELLQMHHSSTLVYKCNRCLHFF